MRLTAIMLFFGTALSASTLFHVACGGQGGSDISGDVWTPDAYFTGGTTWINGGLQNNPYRNLRYGTSFSYNIPVVPGNYEVTFKFIEPNQTSAGKRIFNVFINGLQVVNKLDIFSNVGLLNPYEMTVTVDTEQPNLKIEFKGVLGNAVVSGIQIKSTLTSTLMACKTGTIDVTQLPEDKSEVEILILGVMQGSFRYEHVLLSEFNKFSIEGLTVSMGRPGTNHSELTGAFVPLNVSSGDVNVWYAQPLPPQIFGLYDIVLYFRASSNFTQGSGTLKWEICGYNVQ